MGYSITIRPKIDGKTSRAYRKARESVESIVAAAGAELDGNNPWDPQIRNPDMFGRLLGGGSIAIGESYMDGDWDCAHLDELARRTNLTASVDPLLSNWRKVLYFLYANVVNRQTLQRSRHVADLHYDIDASFFERVLGETMVYSCAYWKQATSLDQAQRNKLDLICQKLDLQPGDRLLDIGCGWGSLANYAARHYGCKVVAVSIASEQIEYAKQRFAHPDVQYMFSDYRDLPEDLGPFDKIVSVGMFEHVGPRNYTRFMNIVTRLLKSGGRFLLHSIVGNGGAKSEPWLNKYIFPNAVIADPVMIHEALNPSLVLEDVQNMRFDYSRTLKAWYENLERARGVDDRLSDERFFRMWRFYLLTTAGSFAAGTRAQLWQMLFTKEGVPETLIAAR